MTHLPVRRHWLKTTFLVLALLPATVVAAPNVVVSLKPLELLVRAVATEDTEVTTLIGPGSNPHNYSMKPSQRRALGEADAVFWIGPEMETFLSRLLNSDEFSARSHAFLPADSDDDHSEESHHHSHDHHGHDHGNGDADKDPHIWLDPARALEMAREIHQVLSEQPDADTGALNANLERFERSLADAEKQIHEQLEPARALSLFTYHNAFTHFAAHYDLPLAGVLTINPELSPGARRIADVQKKLGDATRPCLMTERPFNRESWDPILGDIKVTFTDWDPLASDIEADANGYIAFQQSLADAVLACQ
jgi:zinc transport system substrate-binding protein